MDYSIDRSLTSKINYETSKIDSLKNINYNKIDNNKIKEVSQEFESLFIEQLFKSMRKTIQKSDWLNGGLKQEIFEDMLYQEYSRNISKAGGIGLGKLVYEYLTRKNITKL